MVGLSAGAQKTVCSTTLVQKYLSLSLLGKKKKKFRTIGETKSATGIHFLKRIMKDANRKTSHPIPQKHLKTQSRKYTGSPLHFPVFYHQSKKALKILEVKNMKSQTGFSYLRHLQGHHEWAAQQGEASQGW